MWVCAGASVSGVLPYMAPDLLRYTTIVGGGKVPAKVDVYR